MEGKALFSAVGGVSAPPPPGTKEPCKPDGNGVPEKLWHPGLNSVSFFFLVFFLVFFFPLFEGYC